MGRFETQVPSAKLSILQSINATPATTANVVLPTGLRGRDETESSSGRRCSFELSSSTTASPLRGSYADRKFLNRVLKKDAMVSNRAKFCVKKDCKHFKPLLRPTVHHHRYSSSCRDFMWQVPPQTGVGLLWCTTHGPRSTALRRIASQAFQQRLIRSYSR